MKKTMVLCAGGCGRFVVKGQGECRKCGKARRRSGLKRVKRAEKGTEPKKMKRVRRHG